MYTYPIQIVFRISCPTPIKTPAIEIAIIRMHTLKGPASISDHSNNF